MKVRVLPYYVNGKKGIDIMICDDNATVADYCSVLEEYILDKDLCRLRSKAKYCEGCDTCCGERMPLTSIDAMEIKKNAAPDHSMSDFFNRFTYVFVSGRVVDITLGRDHEDKCIFLDKDTKKCCHYQFRPLVCRTYICTVLSPRATRLREAVVNTGEDELVRQWLECLQQEDCFIHEAERPDIRPEDWQMNSWTGKKSFAEIHLREIVTPALWYKLREKGEDVV